MSGSVSVVELNAGSNKVDSLWVRIRGKANKADILVGVSYRLPNQDEEVDEGFNKQLAEVMQFLSWGNSSYQTFPENTISGSGKTMSLST